MTSKRFRTKPVEIDAIQYTGDNTLDVVNFTEKNIKDVIGSAGTNPDTGSPVVYFGIQVYDKLHDSWINVSKGQWIVRGAKGEYYPCDDETFFWKYEEIESDLVQTRITKKYSDGSSNISFDPPIVIELDEQS